MPYGVSNEFAAFAAYKALNPERVVSDCGSFVHPQLGYLAASLDGLIDNHGLLEIKCPYTARAKRLLATSYYFSKRLPEALATIKNFCLDEKGDLKKNHDYYFQVQGQLEIVDSYFSEN